MPPFNDPDICRDILDGLQIGVSVLDLERKIVFWSDGAEHITGYARIDVLGHSCAENILLHCNQSRCENCTEKCPIVAALHDARPVENLSFIHHKSGHWAPVHTWSIPLRNQHGSIIGIIQTFEGEVAVTGPNPNDRSMREHGCLDDTTGLPNQPMMQSHLREALATFAQFHIPFAMISVQAHELSQFRARYGQEAARSILQVLARTLRNTVWPTDSVGRWSDDCFVVILCGCGESSSQTVKQRVVRMISGATIQWWGEELSLTVSVGCITALAGDSVESLLQRGEYALRENTVTRPGRFAAAGTNSSG
jgi:two-component system cell cycle response regulator